MAQAKAIAGETKTDFIQQFTARTKALRDDRGFTQQRMAELLSVDLETYKKYEQRTPLPHHLINEFCIACDITPSGLFDFWVTKGGQRRGGVVTPARRLESKRPG